MNFQIHLKNRIRKNFLFLSFIFFAVLSAQSQEEQPPDPVRVEIEKKDATVLRGKLLGVVQDSVRFVDDDNNELRIALKDIRNIEYGENRSNRGRWTDSPNTIRYLLAATAMPLRKKDLVLSSTYLFINAVHFGLSDRITLGAGGDLFSGTTYFLNAKVNLWKKPKYAFSTMLNYYQLPPDFIETNRGRDVTSLAMITGAGTWGSANHHLTIGVGYMYTFLGFLPPVLTLSGTTRLTKHFALVSENWYFVVDDRVDLPVLVSLGVRYVSKRSTLDLAYYNDHKSFFDSGLPYIAFLFKLGRR